MEDAHAAVLDLEGESNSNAYFAVYDGHGGMSA
jgi:protein phosphatase 2C family protein 2/3